MTSPQPPAHRPRKDGRWPLQRPTLPPGVSDGRGWVTVNRPTRPDRDPARLINHILSFCLSISLLSSRTRLYFALISRGNPGASTGTSSRVSPWALLASALPRCLSPLVSCTVHACWRLHQCGPDVRSKVSLQVLAPQPCQNPRQPVLHQGGRQTARDAILASQKLRRAQTAPLCPERV